VSAWLFFAGVVSVAVGTVTGDTFWFVVASCQFTTAIFWIDNDD
jgi:hypothetical protein